MAFSQIVDLVGREIKRAADCAGGALRHREIQKRGAANAGCDSFVEPGGGSRAGHSTKRHVDRQLVAGERRSSRTRARDSCAHGGIHRHRRETNLESFFALRDQQRRGEEELISCPVVRKHKAHSRR